MFLRNLFTISLLVTALGVNAQLPAADHEKIKGGELVIQPVSHASLVLSQNNKQIYIDPTGGAEAYKGIPAPDMIIITDIHGDHFDMKTLNAINTANAIIVVPQAVADMMPETFNKKNVVIINNGNSTKQQGIAINALPMYNLPESADARHTKGRGNGYVLTLGDKRIYISGDTEAIPEMRALKNIDIAFVCMNLTLHHGCGTGIRRRTGLQT